MSIADLSTLAQLAQASYVTLADGDAGAALSAKLQTAADDFAATQADQFSAQHSVVLQYDDRSSQGNDTGLSLTVFKDNTTNQLTLAIRGTTSGDPKDLKTDGFIGTGGAGYDQIAALYNWWQRASAAVGTMVPQYVVSPSDQGDPDALAIPAGFLVQKANVAARALWRGRAGDRPRPTPRCDRP